MNAQLIEIELTDKEFIDILNEMYEPVTICGYTMCQGDVLYECDIAVFNEIKNNYEDSIDRNNEQWQCSVCEEIYNNEEDAEECCNDNSDECNE